MADAHKDLEWAAGVLEGTVTTRGPWRSRRGPARDGRSARWPQQQSQRSEQHAGSGGGSGGNPPSSSKKPRQRPQPQPQPQQRRQHRQVQPKQKSGQPPRSSSSSSSSRGSGSGDGLAAYQRPGARSTARVAHCEACDVWVPRRPGDWEVHMAGIRHRRQLLSLRVHGERNRLVLSAFESLPDSAEAAQRLVGNKAVRDFRLERPLGDELQEEQGPAAAAAPLPELLQAARRLRMEALKQLLNVFGVGQMYNAASAAFEERQLAACLQQACQSLEQQRQQQRQQPSSAAVSQCSSWTVSNGAELAALAHLALTGQLDAAELAVKLAPQPQDAPRSQHAGLAAALPLLLPALHSSSSLVELQLELPQPGGADAARVEQLWQSGWQNALPALRGLLKSSAPLRTLRLRLPGCLREPTHTFLPRLQAAAAAAPRAVRAHVLLALHPRAGRCSLLQLLPLAVIGQVLDLAAPLQPCTLHILYVA